MSAPGSVRAQIGGAGVVIAATAVAGVLAYVITWLVPRVVGFGEYAPFAVVWSATYLLVGALSGVGQEVARATSPAAPPVPPSPTRPFTAIAAVAVIAAILASAVLWSGIVFPTDAWSLVIPVAVGAAGYVVAAATSGTVAGLGRWRDVAALMLADAVLRFVTISVGLAVGVDIRGLAWAVAIPFPLAVVVVWPFVRGRVAGRSRVDVGLGGLAANSARTVVASIGTALMITGLPLLIVAMSPGDRRVTLGLIVLCLTLVRAPFVVVAQSLQSFLVVAFRRSGPDSTWIGVRVGMLLALSGVALAGVAAIVGPAVFGVLFPGQPTPRPAFLAILVGSGALLAIALVVSAAILASSSHTVYAAGWVVGAAVTVAVLTLPIDLYLRVETAVLAGPLAALICWSIYLLVSRSRSSRSDAVPA